MWPQETTQHPRASSGLPAPPQALRKCGGGHWIPCKGLGAPAGGQWGPRGMSDFEAITLATVQLPMGLFPFLALNGISPGTSLPVGCPAKEQWGHLLAPSFSCSVPLSLKPVGEQVTLVMGSPRLISWPWRWGCPSQIFHTRHHQQRHHHQDFLELRM